MCSKLDWVIKQNLTKEVKDADSNAARLQTLSLDAIAPMVLNLEEAQKGTLTHQSAAEAAKAALMRLGNASAQMAKERRKRSQKTSTLCHWRKIQKRLKRLLVSFLEHHSKQR